MVRTSRDLPYRPHCHVSRSAYCHVFTRGRLFSWCDRYEDDENGTPYGMGSDLWSLGVLLYVILSGCSPFSADEEDAILSLVAQAK